jgi:hypothetical protein
MSTLALKFVKKVFYIGHKIITSIYCYFRHLHIDVTRFILYSCLLSAISTELQYARSICLYSLHKKDATFLISGIIGHYFWPAAYIYAAAWIFFLLEGAIRLYLQDSSEYLDSSRELLSIGRCHHIIFTSQQQIFLQQ